MSNSKVVNGFRYGVSAVGYAQWEVEFEKRFGFSPERVEKDDVVEMTYEELDDMARSGGFFLLESWIDAGGKIRAGLLLGDDVSVNFFTDIETHDDLNDFLDHTLF